MRFPLQRLHVVVLVGIVATLLMTVFSFIGWLTAAWICAGCLAVLWLNEKRTQLLFSRWATRPFSVPERTLQDWLPAVSSLSHTIADSRSSEKQYIDALREIRNTADNLPDACVVLSQEGIINEMNAACEQLLGITRADEGQYFGGLVRNPALTHAIEELKLRTEVKFKHSDSPQGLGTAQEAIELNSPTNENLKLEVRLIPLDGQRLLLVARDVTQLSKLLSMRQDFIANVSHELRTPLTILIGYVESLSEGTLDAPTIQHLTPKLEAQTNRMRSLVEDLLTLTQLESSSLPDSDRVSLVDGRQLIEALLHEVEALSEGQHDFQISATPNLLVECVEDELRSAILNLLSNAIRYSPDGGLIAIQWHEHDQSHVRFQLSDQGIGIPATDLSRVTERFYRVAGQPTHIHRGTGLGLAIVKHVLLRHQSQLHIESTYGEGSLFYFDLPKKLSF